MKLTNTEKIEILDDSISLLKKTKNCILNGTFNQSINCVFICNAVREAIQNKYQKNKDIINLEDYLPELEDAIFQHGKELCQGTELSYNTASPWPLSYGAVTISAIEYRINWLENFKNKTIERSIY